MFPPTLLPWPKTISRSTAECFHCVSSAELGTRIGFYYSVPAQAGLRTCIHDTEEDTHKQTCQMLHQAIENCPPFIFLIGLTGF